MKSDHEQVHQTMNSHPTTPVENRSAQFSDDRKYRYDLWVCWDDSRPLVQFIGLNPSTADETKDDPTLRKVKKFAHAWGYGGVVMTNLFAWRATDPSEMLRVSKPIGEEGKYIAAIADDSDDLCREFDNRNDLAIYTAHQTCKDTIAAWGTHGYHLYRAVKVKQWLTGMKCLRLTGAGQPYHPLYIPDSTVPIPFN